MRVLAAVGQHSPDFLFVRLMDEFHSVKHPLHPWRFAAAKVALHPFGAHQLASAGDLKPPLGSLVRLQLLLRHGVVRPPFLAQFASA